MLFKVKHLLTLNKFMDFKEFLKNEGPYSEIDKKEDKKENKKEQNLKENKKEQNLKENKKEQNLKENKKEQNKFFNTNEFLLKKGDFVKIIRTPRKNGETNRSCDIYTGYFGEIKNIYNNQFQDNEESNIATAIVSLEAVNNYPKIKFPMDCLVKRNN
jgi:hypothetical protein